MNTKISWAEITVLHHRVILAGEREAGTSISYADLGVRSIVSNSFDRYVGSEDVFVALICGNVSQVYLGPRPWKASTSYEHARRTHALRKCGEYCARNQRLLCVRPIGGSTS